MEQPEWTVECAMRELGLSSSTAYQYFRSLVDAGLLISSRTGCYAIGPVVISWDRILRRHDPLVQGARPSMETLAQAVGAGGIALLCKSFKSTVLCVDQRSLGATLAISYERGRPMPLFKGAASKAILAQLSSRTTRRLWDHDAAAISAAGLGEDWPAFKLALRKLRKTPALITYGEIDAGLVGFSAAVFDAQDLVCGSLGIVVSAKTLADHDKEEDRLRALVAQEALRLTSILKG